MRRHIKKVETLITLIKDCFWPVLKGDQDLWINSNNQTSNQI